MKKKISVFLVLMLAIMTIVQCAVSDGCRIHGKDYTSSSSSSSHCVYINGLQHVKYVSSLGWCDACGELWTNENSFIVNHNKIYRNYVDRRDYVCAECNHVFSTHKHTYGPWRYYSNRKQRTCTGCGFTHVTSR